MGRKDVPHSGRDARLALLTPRSQRDAGCRTNEREGGRDFAGQHPLSWLIAPELRLQFLFFPTCTGAGTSAAAMGSHR